MSTAWSQPVPPVAQAPDGQIPAQPSPAPQSPYPYPYPYMVQAGPSQTAENTATWLMILTGVVGLIATCLPYYVISETYSYSRVSETISGSGWLVPYSGLAGFAMICGAALAFLDSGIVAKPKGSDEAPYRKYAQLAAFGGAAVFALASSQLYPSVSGSSGDIGELLGMGVGFWLLICSAVIGLIGAMVAYVAWVNKTNPKPVLAIPAWPQAAPVAPVVSPVAPPAPAPTASPAVPAWMTPPAPPAPPAPAQFDTTGPIMPPPVEDTSDADATIPIPDPSAEA